MLLKSSVRAFTLIELLIVLAIIVVLASLGIPAYSDYLVKARVTELLTTAESYKLKLIENLSSSTVNNRNVYNINSDLVESVTVTALDTNPAQYMIQVVAKMKNREYSGIGISKPSAASSNLAIQLQGAETGDMINWTCHAEAAYHKYVPRSCQHNLNRTL